MSVNDPSSESTHRSDEQDPGADTETFRAYVQERQRVDRDEQRTSTLMLAGVGAALVVVVILIVVAILIIS